MALTSSTSSDKIDIPELPVIKHRSSFFRDGFLSICMIGKSGCGKTQMLASILPGISDSIRTIVIATKVRNAPAHLAIQRYFKSQKGKYCGICDDPKILNSFVTMAEDQGLVSLRKQALLIFDDFNDGKATGPYWQFIIHAFTKLRNSGWNFIILAQNPTFIPPIVRNCTTARVLFNCYVKSAIQGFTKDLVERVPDRAAFNALVQYIQQVPYSYLFVKEMPFEILVGKGATAKSVITQHSVVIPTINELMGELGVHNRQELDTKTKELQKQAGNDAPELSEKQKELDDDEDDYWN